MQANIYKLPLSSQEITDDYTHWAVIKAPTSSKTDRIPVHIIAVIDTSGSMDFCNKLENVKRSLIAIIETLNGGDLFSLITFSDEYKILMDSVNVTEDLKYHVKQIIKSLDTTGSTNISGGLISAFELKKTPAHKTSILLLTDGEANKGITDPDALIHMIKENCDVTTTIHTFGYGEDHNSKLLNIIAEERSGGYSFVNNLDDVASSIANAFGSSAFCAMQNTRACIGENLVYKCGYNGTNNSIVIGDMMVDSELGIFIKAADCVGTIEIEGYNIQNGAKKESVTLNLKHTIEASDSEILNAKKTMLRLKMAGYIEKTPSLEEVKEFDKKCLDILGVEDDIYKAMKYEIDRIIKSHEVPDPLNTAFIMHSHHASRRQHINYFRNLRTIFNPDSQEQHMSLSRIIEGLTPLDTQNIAASLSAPMAPRATRAFTGLSPVARSVTQAVYDRATRSSECDMNT